MTPQMVSNFPVPGAPPGTVFYEIGDGVSNGNGDIVFTATFGPLEPAPDFEPQQSTDTFTRHLGCVRSETLHRGKSPRSWPPRAITRPRPDGTSIPC